MSGHVAKAIVLSVFDTVLASLALAAVEPQLAAPAFVLGLGPAGALAAAIGWLAGRARGDRLATLLVAALACVAFEAALGAGISALAIGPHVQPVRGSFVALVTCAWVPTSLLTIVLERWTRPGDPIPRARWIRRARV